MAYFLTLHEKKYATMRNIFLLSTLMILLLDAGCKRHKSAPTPQPLHIATTEALADSIVMHYRSAVHLVSNYTATIAPRVNGYLLRKHFTAGKQVRRGDLLFEIEASLLRTSLRSAEADLAAAIADEASARSDYERAQPLARLEAISASQLDAYRASFLSAEGRVRAAREAVDRARLEVGYARIYSPIDGIVAHSEAHEGDYVGPETKFATLTTVAATDTLTADISLPTALYMRYPMDDSALLSDITLHLASGEKYPFAGRYSYTRQAASPTSGTVTLVVAFPNPALQLKAGEYGEVEYGLGSRQMVITIPQQAVSTMQGKHSVWVIEKDSTTHWREVTLGEVVGDRWIILDGLQAGERVAVEGSQKLRQGEKVIPKTE